MAPQLSHEIPASDEYRALRVAAGLSAMSEEGAAIGLPASWCAVCVRDEKKKRLGPADHAGIDG